MSNSSKIQHCTRSQGLSLNTPSKELVDQACLIDYARCDESLKCAGCLTLQFPFCCDFQVFYRWSIRSSKFKWPLQYIFWLRSISTHGKETWRSRYTLEDSIGSLWTLKKSLLLWQTKLDSWTRRMKHSDSYASLFPEIFFSIFQDWRLERKSTTNWKSCMESRMQGWF